MDELTEAQLAAELRCTTCGRYRLWVVFRDLWGRRLCRDCHCRRQTRRNELRRLLRRELKVIATMAREVG